MDDAHEDDTSPASDRCDLTAEVQLVQDPHVHFNVYMAGTRPLSYYEEALRTEFLALHIYLIRGVDVADIQAPPQNQAEALAFWAHWLWAGNVAANRTIARHVAV